MADEGLCPLCHSPRSPEDVRCRACGSELPQWAGAETAENPIDSSPFTGPPLPAPPTRESGPVLTVPGIPPPAAPADQPVAPAAKRSIRLEVVAVVVVVAIAGTAAVVLAMGGDDRAPAPVAAPPTATSPSPTSSAAPRPETPTPEASPSPPISEGQPLSIEGIDLRLTSATRRDRYVSGDQTFLPGAPGDTFLVIRGTFEGNSDRLLEFEVSVVDENGRRDVPSVTVTDVNLTEGQGMGDVEWALAVSESSSSFTFDLPEGNSVDVTLLLASA